MEKKKLLEKLTNTIIDEIKYECKGSELLSGHVTSNSQAQIIPYRDDSIWQDNEPSAVSIGKILAKTTFGIREIVEMCMDNYQSVSPWKSQQDMKAESEKNIISTYKELEMPMKLAIDQTIAIVGRTKPSWAMPSRSQRHLETIITCEVTWSQMAGDTSAISAISALSNKNPLHLAHPLLKGSSASEDRERWQAKLQQSKWRSEREANSIWSVFGTLKPTDELSAADSKGLRFPFPYK